MAISRSAGYLTAACASAALLITAAPAPFAMADDAGAVITFDNISAGQTISGTADVTFTVQGDPDDEPTSAVVSISGYGPGTGTVKQTIALAAGDCLPSCTLHAALDTTATQQFGGTTNGVAVPLVNDGSRDIHIEVNSPRPRTVTADTTVTVDNNEPVVSLPDLPADDNAAWATHQAIGLSADDTLSLRAVASGDNGVSGVRFFSSSSAWPAPVDLTDPDGDGVWTGTVDTSAVPSELYLQQWVVAYDKDGRAGTPVLADTLVDHGFTLTPQLASVINPGMGSIALSYAYPKGLTKAFPSDLNYAYPVSTSLLLDGKALVTTPVWGYTYEGDTAGLSVTLGDNVLPYGAHTLTFDAVDNRGAHGRTEVPVTVVSSVEPTWTAGFSDFPVAGHTWKAAATTSAEDGISRAESWTLAVDGTTVSTGSYPAQPSGSWKAVDPGVHEVKLTIVSQYGDTTTSELPLRVLAATSTKLTGPATITYGGKAAYTAKVTKTGGTAAAGAKVSFQFKAAGTTTWKTAATRTADSAGKAAFTTTASRNGVWRAVTAAKNLAWVASTSSNLTTKVKAKLTVKTPATKAARGRTVAFTASSSPLVKGTPVLFQRQKSDGTWVTLTSTTLTGSGTTGTATGKITFSRTGTWKLRVYRPATTRLADTYSATWTVKVS
ncbi:hypothetical protein OG607_21270 [Streptomyces sp. NBC_01537]|uniref:hypothetical protein n=1 Tax=Streptomyces sp. NBC_01537 TaxID=2903896 RepID=UPI0038678FA9